jgi:predicted nucleic acid-binding protein
VPEILAKLDGIDLFMSVVTRVEFLSKPGMLPNEETKRRTFLDGITLMDFNTEIQDETVAIRRAKKLKFPDAVVAATAVLLEVTALTDDPHLLGLSWPGFAARNLDFLM